MTTTSTDRICILLLISVRPSLHSTFNAASLACSAVHPFGTWRIRPSPVHLRPCCIRLSSLPHPNTVMRSIAIQPLALDSHHHHSQPAVHTPPNSDTGSVRPSNVAVCVAVVAHPLQLVRGVLRIHGVVSGRVWSNERDASSPSLSTLSCPGETSVRPRYSHVRIMPSRPTPSPSKNSTQLCLDSRECVTARAGSSRGGQAVLDGIRIN